VIGEIRFEVAVEEFESRYIERERDRDRDRGTNTDIDIDIDIDIWRLLLKKRINKFLVFLL
jgi:hypothetical protein